MLQPCKPNRAPTAPPANLTVHPLHTQLCTHSTSCKPALLQLHPRGKPLRSASVLRVQNSDIQEPYTSLFAAWLFCS